MDPAIITSQDKELRTCWIGKIARLSNNFSMSADRVEQELSDEMERCGTRTLVGHLRLCGAIPESYGHDSSEEKLYSKYTDIVAHEAFKAVGLDSLVLSERRGVADVECVCDDYGLVADAKAFRLSRTAKNQKDFKVQAMDNWKHGKRFAMLVCPVYQLPSRSSQIYQQAGARSVCISTYTHLAVLVRYAEVAGASKAVTLLYNVLKSVEVMNPSRDAAVYWQTVNRAVLAAEGGVSHFWREEKIASVEAMEVARAEALTYLAEERERIMKLSRRDAIREILQWRRMEGRVRTVGSVQSNGLLDHGDAG